MKHYIARVLSAFIPLAAVITILTGLVYVSVHQVLRQGANDPQIEYAQDWAADPHAGSDLAARLQPSVDIGKSLALFATIYDNNGNVLGSSGQLNGQDPKLPDGIFEYVRNIGEDRVTWQPEPGVRVALVVTRYSHSGESGFIAVGRSLREVERRSELLQWYAAGAWFIALVLSLILIAGLEALAHRLRA